jgi:hypothetical protein
VKLLEERSPHFEKSSMTVQQGIARIDSLPAAVTK